MSATVRFDFSKAFEFEPKRDYTGIDIDHLIELGDFIYRNPLIEVLEEYKELFNIAYHNDLLSPVINATNSDTADSSYASEKVPVIEGAETIKNIKIHILKGWTEYTQLHH